MARRSELLPPLHRGGRRLRAARKTPRKSYKKISSVRKSTGIKSALSTWGTRRGVTPSVKTYETYDSDVVSLDSHKLYGFSLSVIPKTTTNNISARQRDVCILESVSYQFDVHNKSTTSALQCNMAIVSPKKAGSLFSAAGVTSYPGFFRSPGSVDTRVIDFSDTMDALDKHTLPINSDMFRVLSHKRFSLNPRSTFVNGTQLDFRKPNFKQVTEYVRIGKEMQYSDIDSEPETGRIYLVYWFTGFQLGTTPVESATCLIKGRGSFKEAC